MADPLIEKALALKKELETDTPPEFQGQVKPIMDEIMKIILGGVQPRPNQKKQ